jgi:hypothetical protein
VEKRRRKRFGSATMFQAFGHQVLGYRTIVDDRLAGVNLRGVGSPFPQYARVSNAGKPQRTMRISCIQAPPLPERRLVQGSFF